MKRITFISIIFIFTTIQTFAKTSENISKFIKGNIYDKTAAVREASAEDSPWLSNKAIEFTLDNIKILGNDRELDGLAVAAILSISNDYVKNLTETQKKDVENQFIQLFSEFSNSSTVQIAILTKIVSLKDNLNTRDFTNLLNNYFKTNRVQDIDPSVFKSALTAFETLGNADTFIILYNFLYNPKYESYTSQLSKTVSKLIPSCMNETIGLIQTSNMKQLINIYNLATKNAEISKNNLCEISEKVLSKSILLMDGSSSVSQEDIDIQINALKVLTENKWTRASTITVSYFKFAKVMFLNGIISEEQFVTTITSLNNVAPIESVSSLTSYLEELNSQKERGNSVSTEIVLAVIQTLGAIGDKSAFDSLLSVTYLNYEESILTAAREALSGLRW